MASSEHIELASFLKEVHSSLRKESTRVGADQAWSQHCQNRALLSKYAKYMERLATYHWTKNCADESTEAVSRIEWAVNFCYDYFINGNFAIYRQKELDIAKKINIVIDTKEIYSQPLKLIDVGSCYNPFKSYEYLDVTAIDLHPANEFVLECDFLDVSIGPSMSVLNGKVEQLLSNFFDVVTFCFLLEYIPTSKLRIKACEKAYNILKPGGLLIVNTPDSKHVGANSKIMKTWQYTLALKGFTRIKYEKLKHMHCMAFRKAVCKETAIRWATLHHQQYMEQVLQIPQDYKCVQEPILQILEVKSLVEDFKELPFCNF